LVKVQGHTRHIADHLLMASSFIEMNALLTEKRDSEYLPRGLHQRLHNDVT